MSVTWNAVSGATSYERRLRRTDPLPHDLGGPSEVNGTTTSFDVTGGATYAVDVRSKNVAGTSDWATVTDLQVHLSTPTGLVVTPGNEEVAVTWAAVEGASDYEVSYRLVEDTQSRAARTFFIRRWAYLISPNNSIIIRSLKTGGTYEFRVKARSHFTNDSNSSTVHSEPSESVDSTLPRAVISGTPSRTVPENYRIMTCTIYEMYTTDRTRLYVGKHCFKGTSSRTFDQLIQSRYRGRKPGHDIGTATKVFLFWVGAPDEMTMLKREAWFTINDRAAYCLEKDRIAMYEFSLLTNQNRGSCDSVARVRASELRMSGAVAAAPATRPISGSNDNDDPPGSSGPSDPPDRYCPITGTWIPESECDDASETDDDPPGSS